MIWYEKNISYHC